MEKFVTNSHFFFLFSLYSLYALSPFPSPSNPPAYREPIVAREAADDTAGGAQFVATNFG